MCVHMVFHYSVRASLSMLFTAPGAGSVMLSCFFLCIIHRVPLPCGPGSVICMLCDTGRWPGWHMICDSPRPAAEGRVLLRIYMIYDLPRPSVKGRDLLSAYMLYDFDMH